MRESIKARPQDAGGAVDMDDGWTAQGARALGRRKGILPVKVYQSYAALDRGVHGWLNPQVRNHRLSPIVRAGKYALGGLAAYAVNKYAQYQSPTTMAPIIRRARKYVSRRRAAPMKRRYRKKAPMRRRMRGKRRSYRGRRGSPLQRAIRKSSKRIKMGHYTNEKRYVKICDVYRIGDFDLETFSSATTSGQERPLAEYKNLDFNINTACPNLLARITGVGADDFDEFKIDKITYKIVVLNARQLSMEPNYRAPDGGGQNTVAEPTSNMTNVHQYISNSYVFHKRWQNDVLPASGDFTDWQKLRNGMKGSATFVNLFKQKGKMFNTAITGDRADSIYVDNVSLAQKKYGIPLGWQTATPGIKGMSLGQAGLILPGCFKYGWDAFSTNIVPKLRVTVRICSQVRANAASTDVF